MDIDSLIAQTAQKIHNDHCTRDVLHDVASADAYWVALVENGLNLAWVSEEAGGFGGTLPEVAGAIWNMTPSPIPFVETVVANKLLEYAGLNVIQGSASFAIGSSAAAHSVPMGNAVDDIILFDEAAQVISHYKQADLSAQSTSHLSPDQDINVDFALAKPIDSKKTNLSLRAVEAIILTLCAVQMAAAMDGALALSIDYVSTREQFGRPLSKFQAIQHQLAIAASESAAAVMAASQACAALEEQAANPELAWHETVIAKVQIGHSIECVTTAFQQVHGAMGYTMEYDLHHYTRRLWAWRDALGNEHIWAQKLGEELATKNSDQLWQGVTAGAW